MAGGRDAALEVAKETGCEMVAEVIEGSNIFQFECHHVRRRSVEPDYEVRE